MKRDYQRERTEIANTTWEKKKKIRKSDKREEKQNAKDCLEDTLEAKVSLKNSENVFVTTGAHE